MTSSVGTIRQTLTRLQADNILVTESALRRWVKVGQIPVAYCGRAYLWYENVLDFLRHGEVRTSSIQSGLGRVRPVS